MRSLTRPIGLLVTTLFLSLIFINLALAFECTNACKQTHLATGSFRVEGGALEALERPGDEAETPALLRRIAGAVLDFLVPSARAATEGSSNNFFGTDAGANNSGDNDNSFFGGSAGNKNTTGINNAFFGTDAGYSSTTGSDNAFFGTFAGYSNTTGFANAFFGRDAGFSNTTGSSNAFFGRTAGSSNTTGFANTFFGTDVGESNTTGFNNAFFGRSAGVSNTTGGANAFFGRDAGDSNTTGNSNAFFGRSAGLSNTVEHDNAFIGAFSNGAAGITNATAIGYQAQVEQSNAMVLGSIPGVNNGTAYVDVAAAEGTFSTAVGASAVASGFGSTALGVTAAASGSNSTALGHDAAATGDSNTALGTVAFALSPNTNATAIGYQAQVEQSNAMVLGSIPGVNNGTAYVDVGIGTTMPQAPLHVERANGTARVQVTETQPGPSMPFQGQAQGLVRFELNDEAAGERWRFTNAGDKFAINNVGGDSPGTEMSVFKNGDLVIGGLLTENSDRDAKQNIVPLVSQDILAKIVNLEVLEWSYIDAPNQRHIGPMAQDFHSAFGLGRDNKHIATLDTSGVALVGIQALAEENAMLRNRVEQLESRQALLQEVLLQVRDEQRAQQIRTSTALN